MLKDLGDAGLNPESTGVVDMIDVDNTDYVVTVQAKARAAGEFVAELGGKTAKNGPAASNGSAKSKTYHSLTNGKDKVTSNGSVKATSKDAASKPSSAKEAQPKSTSKKGQNRR